MTESDVFFGWLSDEDRRIIRSLRDPVLERVEQSQLRQVVLTINDLLNDPRNVDLIGSQLPEEFLSFQDTVLSSGRQVSGTGLVREFMADHWLGIVTGYYPKTS